MAIDIRTIRIVTHKDGSTEDVTCFDESFEGIIFGTLQDNLYLYREYCDEHDNIFNNPFHTHKSYTFVGVVTNFISLIMNFILGKKLITL